MNNAKLDIYKIPDEELRSALYNAESCNRYPVTAKWLVNHDDPDNINAYIYIKNNNDVGLDPWIHLNGWQLLNGGTIVLEYNQYNEKMVSQDYIVFVQPFKGWNNG